MVYKEVWVFISQDQDPGEVLREELRRLKVLYPFATTHILKFKPGMDVETLRYAISGVLLEDVPPFLRSAVSIMRRYGVKMLPSVAVTYTNGYSKVVCEGVIGDDLIACVRQLYAKKAHLLER